MNEEKDRCGSKRICNILSDLVSVSDRPVVVGGEIYKNRSGIVNIDIEARDSILEAMARIHCRSIGYGTYDCYENTIHGFSVDSCLVGEVNNLVNRGIRTIGCCCGHGKDRPYIQVSSECCEKMVALGYERRDGSEWCFSPKTSLPTQAAGGKRLQEWDDGGGIG